MKFGFLFFSGILSNFSAALSFFSVSANRFLRCILGVNQEMRLTKNCVFRTFLDISNSLCMKLKRYIGQLRKELTDVVMHLVT